ncbi:MAG: hypothetical protein R3D03_04630 [Geminicoccaceae bacterium]
MPSITTAATLPGEYDETPRCLPAGMAWPGNVLSSYAAMIRGIGRALLDADAPPVQTLGFRHDFSHSRGGDQPGTLGAGMVDVKVIVGTQPYEDQKAGTSGLRGKVPVFEQEKLSGVSLSRSSPRSPDSGARSSCWGGDGRYFNKKAIQVILTRCRQPPASER